MKRFFTGLILVFLIIMLGFAGGLGYSHYKDSKSLPIKTLMKIQLHKVKCKIKLIAKQTKYQMGHQLKHLVKKQSS
ncbi:Uncharacterised protein [Mycobacteroides abscessus subsp. massiliense]|nr:Uncharacterised protein [Mycobacteroides abscessus subsp. massiliense]